VAAMPMDGPGHGAGRDSMPGMAPTAVGADGTRGCSVA
jgi:hypothetical protein